MSAGATGLIADIGATNTRLAHGRAGRRHHARSRVRDRGFRQPGRGHRGLSRGREPPPKPPTRAVLAVAAPVAGDTVAMTNHPWTFSVDAVRQHFGFSALRVINDFVANALAVPHLTDADRRQVGGGAPVRAAPIGVLGPGSGLGVSTLIPDAAARRSSSRARAATSPWRRPTTARRRCSN